MSEIAENLRHVAERIAAAARAAGRSPDEVTLVAVSKTVPSERIAEAYAAGMRDFGENYYQEAREKLDALPPEARWHFIGHLQSNKAKYLVGRFALVQSVDSEPLALELSRRAEAAGVVQPVLIEVKLDPADTKGGVAPGAALALAETVAGLPGLRLDGLMGMPPFDADPRPYFAEIRGLFERLPDPSRRVLSMGMSGDFEQAISEGSTMVRVGTAIFGRR